MPFLCVGLLLEGSQKSSLSTTFFPQKVYDLDMCLRVSWLFLFFSSAFVNYLNTCLKPTVNCYCSAFNMKQNFLLFTSLARKPSIRVVWFLISEAV